MKSDDTTYTPISKPMLKRMATRFWAMQYWGLPPCSPGRVPSDRLCDVFGYTKARGS